MRVHSLCQTALWGVFFVSLLGICSADDKTLFEVVGAAECADCNEYDIKTTEAFSGLSASVDCKFEHGETKRMGDITKLDKDGKFNISVSQLHQDCYVQIHSAAAVLCAAHIGVESTKIVLKSQTNGIQTFGPSKNPQFSTATCASKFSWHFFKHPHPWKKKFPYPVHKPPVPEHKPPVRVYKPKPPVHKPPVYKPKPPVHKPPVYKPKPPVHKPPVYKPKPPVHKPPVYKPKPPVHKPPVPVHKPKPPVPVYKPKPPVYKPPVPVYKPPVPVYHPKPPVYKKPFPKIKFPPKHFHHPKFGHFPPLPPHHP